LNHGIYHIGSGRLNTNAEIVAAQERHVRGIALPVLHGRPSAAPPADPFLDLIRIRRDTGYEPEYDLDRGIAEHVAWLRSGHDR
jgi:UDP-glucose 4-epimerase